MSSVSQSSTDTSLNPLFDYLEKNPKAKRKEVEQQFGSLDHLNSGNENLVAAARKCGKFAALNWLLFDYLEQNPTAKRAEVELSFGPLDQLSLENETLVGAALKCHKIGAANWLQQVGVPVSRDMLDFSSDTGLKRSESVNGDNEKYNTMSIEFLSLDEHGMIKFAEENRETLHKLRLENDPLVKYLVKNGQWKVATILMNHGVIVDEATMKIARDWLCEALLCKDQQTVVDKENEMIRRLRFYPGDFTQRVDINGNPELFFMLILRLKNENVTSAFLDLAQLNAIDIAYKMWPEEEREAAELAQGYSKILTAKVLKVIKGRHFLSMDEQEQKNYVAEFGTGSLYLDRKPLLGEFVSSGSLELAELLIKFGARVDAYVISKFQRGVIANEEFLKIYGARVDAHVVSEFQKGILQINERFSRNYLNNPVAQTEAYTCLSTGNVQGFVKQIAIYNGDLNAAIKSGSASVPFFLAVLKKRNPLMLGAFLRRVKELGQKLQINLSSPEGREVERLLPTFSEALQAEAAYAMGTITPSLPCLLIVLRSQDFNRITEFLKRAKDAEQKIKIHANTAEMREYKVLLQKLPLILQPQVEERVDCVEDIVKGLSLDPEISISTAVQSAFAEFQSWNDDKRVACLKQIGMDRLQISSNVSGKFKTLLGEMISRKYWKAAKFLVEHGARVDATVLEEFAKVADSKFKTTVLDSAVAISKLVKTYGKAKKEETIFYINLFQGDFHSEILINKITAPLYRHLLNLKDTEITEHLTNRMRALNQDVNFSSAYPVPNQPLKLMPRQRTDSNSDDS